MVVKEKKVAETNEETVEEKKEQTVVEEQQVVTDPVVESFEEHEPEPLTETQKLDALLKSVEEFAEREAKFNTMVFPVVKSINTKSWWILSLSILAIFILFFLFYFISGKFSENEKALSEISQTFTFFREESKEIGKSLEKKISETSEKVDNLKKDLDKNQTAVMSWLKPAAEMLDNHEAKFVKMTKEVSYLKNKKTEEIKKAEEEAAKKDLEIENPPTVDDLPVPAEEKKDNPSNEGSEDSGNTDSSKKISSVGKAMPEIDKSDDSEGEIKITVRKIKK